VYYRRANSLRIYIFIPTRCESRLVVLLLLPQADMKRISEKDYLFAVSVRRGLNIALAYQLTRH
ncbi:MAG: hypothetical protein IJ957_08245, partial [Rikenellaceae bacterium]|nr:hypothetical protein [Rikenellaceae bacterium]